MSKVNFYKTFERQNSEKSMKMCRISRISENWLQQALLSMKIKQNWSKLVFCEFK